LPARSHSALSLSFQFTKEGRKKLPAISRTVCCMCLCVQSTLSRGGRRTLKNHHQWRK
jgi:hypothetical protein